MQFVRRTHVPASLLILAPLAAVAVALVLSGILIAIAGANPLTAYARMLTSAFGSRLSITETLTRTTPLILTGLAAAVAFRARVWNIGGEGQFYLGALAVAALGHVSWPGSPPSSPFRSCWRPGRSPGPSSSSARSASGSTSASTRW